MQDISYEIVNCNTEHFKSDDVYFRKLKNLNPVWMHRLKHGPNHHYRKIQKYSIKSKGSSLLKTPTICSQVHNCRLRSYLMTFYCFTIELGDVHVTQIENCDR